MMFSLSASIILLSVTAFARPIKREVPQEHSHNKILAAVNTSLKVNNPDGIVDAVFGLLGNAAAAAGLGKITDANCLQQATADQAFSNALAAKDVDGQVNALIYRALERNSGSVGLATTPCTTIKAANPQIAAISQHQDPASPNAASTNKAIVLTLAQQIQSVGGDPQLALQSGTFAPGKIGDPTAKGNSCDTADDTEGCIFSQNLLVDDATPAEISAAVAGVAAATGAGGAAIATAAADVSSATAAADVSAATASADTAASCPADVTVTVAAASASETAAASTASSGSSTTSPSNTGSLNFGKCTDPTVKFGPGLDGRKPTEFSFIPNDQAQFSHDSALNPDIIFQFTCDNLVNNCGLTQTDTAVTTCRSAQTTADAKGKTGSAADTFNGLLGFKTNFAALDAAAAAATATA